MLATRRTTIPAFTAALGAAALAPSGTAGAATRPPTARQIVRAVAAAERSRSLWATVNVCNTRRYRDVVGVRGQMPSLGFRATLSMRVQLNAYSAARKQYIVVTGHDAVNQVTLGSHATGLQQGGALFPFNKGVSGRWNATFTFTWARGTTVIGKATRTTTAGHRDADFGSPAHHSAASCTIAR